MSRYWTVALCLLLAMTWTGRSLGQQPYTRINMNPTPGIGHRYPVAQTPYIAPEHIPIRRQEGQGQFRQAGYSQRPVQPVPTESKFQYSVYQPRSPHAFSKQSESQPYARQPTKRAYPTRYASIVPDENPFADDPQDPFIDTEPGEDQDPFDDPRQQVPQQTPPIQKGVDPFADPPIEPVPNEPELSEPTLPAPRQAVPELQSDSQQPPVPSQDQTPYVEPMPVIREPSRLRAPAASPPRQGAGQYAPASPYQSGPPVYPQGSTMPFYAPMNPGEVSVLDPPYPGVVGGPTYPGHRPNGLSANTCCRNTSPTNSCSCDLCVEPDCDLPFYLSLFGGYSKINTFGQEFEPGAEQNIFDFDDGYGLGFALGTKQGFNMRSEFDFAFRQVQLNSFGNSLSLPPGQASGDLNSYSGMWNVYWEFMCFPKRCWKPYIGGGVGFAFVEADFVSDGVSVVVDNDSSFAYQGMAGVNYKFSYRTDLFIEYRYFGATDIKFDSPYVASSNIGLGLEDIILGIRLKF